jgi:hypothetical protein
LIYKNINDLSPQEWDRIIYLSKQTRHHIRHIDDKNLYKIYYGRYSELCKNYQLYDEEDNMIANCFVDRVKLHNDEITFTGNYLTGLNRDLDNKYRGTGSMFLDIILNKYNLMYLKPANEKLETMYKNLGFFPTNLKGIGNCRFPIYCKYSNLDFPKDEFNEKFILK